MNEGEIMKNQIVAIMAIALLSLGSIAKAGGGMIGSNQSCPSSVRAQQLAVYILNDNLKHFANKAVERQQFTTEELFGSSQINNRAELMNAMNSNDSLLRTYNQINSTLGHGWGGFAKEITRLDIERNVSAESFCNE
jgi:hypothetical protein